MGSFFKTTRRNQILDMELNIKFQKPKNKKQEEETNKQEKWWGAMMISSTPAIIIFPIGKWRLIGR